MNLGQAIATAMYSAKDAYRTDTPDHVKVMCNFTATVAETMSSVPANTPKADAKIK